MMSELREFRGQCSQIKIGAGIVTGEGQERDHKNEESVGLRVSGYAAVFGGESERMWGGVVETIARDAFDDVLASDPDVRFQAGHEGLALARTGNGSLELSTDDAGLRFVAHLNPAAQVARDLHALIDRGDVDQMSFGFTADWRELECEHENCTLEHVEITKVRDLFEISAVTFPAYPQTEVKAREVEPVIDAAGVEERVAGEGEHAATQLAVARHKLKG